jgi:heavy metal sensor kinase
MKRLLNYAPLYNQIRRLSKSLRFRVALSYTIFFAMLLAPAGFLLRAMLTRSLETELQGVVSEEWAAAKGYMRIENYRPMWYYDRVDPEEALIVNQIKGGVYLLMDANRKVLEISDPYKALPLDSQEEISRVIKLNQPVWVEKKDEDGVRYMLRQGVIVDNHRLPYYMVIGKPLTDIEATITTFERNFFLVGALAVLFGALLGWLMAGRALIPLNAVATAAQEMTGSNLQVRIPLRGAGDELDRMITAFNDMTGRLDQSFQQIRQFSTDVSHELRTPLTAIRGQLEVALFTAKTAEQYKDAMVNALQDVEHLSNIVRALLLLSQAESGQLVLQMTPLDLAPVVEDITEQFQIPAEEQKLTLRSEIEPGGCRIRADRTQIGRLVTNLISNAVKYTPPGGRVVVRLKHPSPDSVQFIVEDTGIGISKDHLPHIFDRFYRVRPAHRSPVQGLGLGLSFVAWIVQAHNGKIDIDSTEGKGTTFTVTFPAAGSVESIEDHLQAPADANPLPSST